MGGEVVNFHLLSSGSKKICTTKEAEVEGVRRIPPSKWRKLPQKFHARVDVGQPDISHQLELLYLHCLKLL